MPIVPQINQASQVSDTNNSNEQIIVSFRNTAINLITDPKKIILVPKYLFREWNGFLKAPSLSFVVGVHQAGFLSKVKNAAIARRSVSTAHIGYWCGLNKQRVSKILKESGATYLRWFISRIEEPIENTGLKSVYDIRVNMPLTPYDIGIVATTAERLFPIWKNSSSHGLGMSKFISYLEGEIEGDRKKGSKVKVDIPERVGDYCSIQNILSQYFDEVNVNDVDACEELEAKFTRPQDCFTISHYFIRHWLPDFGTSQNYIILYMLRLKSYKKEAPGHLYFKSQNALCQYLQVDKRTVSQLLKDIENGISPLANFIKINRNSKTGIEIIVRMNDPVHPKHRSEYNRIYQEISSGIDPNLILFDENKCDPWSHSKLKYFPNANDFSDEQQNEYLFQYDTPHMGVQNVDGNVDLLRETAVHNVDGKINQTMELKAQNVDGLVHKVDGLVQNVDGYMEQNVDAPVQNVDTLIKLINKGKNNNQINKQEQLQHARISKSIKLFTPNQSVVVVNGWDINKILDLGGIPDNGDRQSFIQEYVINPKVGENFLARWLFALTKRRTGSEEKGVVAPEWMALRQYKKNTPIEFIQLAKIGPDEMYEQYFSPENIWGAVGTRFSDTISLLKNKGFEKILENFISEDNLLDGDLENIVEPKGEEIDNTQEDGEIQINKIQPNIPDDLPKEPLLLINKLFNVLKGELSIDSYEKHISTLKIEYEESKESNEATIWFVSPTRLMSEWIKLRYSTIFDEFFSYGKLSKKYQVIIGENEIPPDMRID